MKKSILLAVLFTHQVAAAECQFYSASMSYSHDGILAHVPTESYNSTFEPIGSTIRYYLPSLDINIEWLQIQNLYAEYPSGTTPVGKRYVASVVNSTYGQSLSVGGVNQTSELSVSSEKHTYTRDTTLRNLASWIYLPPSVKTPGPCPSSVPISYRITVQKWWDGNLPQQGSIIVNGTLKLRPAQTKAELTLDRTVITTNCSKGSPCAVRSSATAEGDGKLLSITWGARPGVSYELNGVVMDEGVITTPTKGKRYTIAIHLSGSVGENTFSIPVTANFA